jgi:hypothetical protein
MNTKLENAVKRARAYWFIDGFTEMGAGGLFILLAGIILFRWNSQETTLPSWFLSVSAEIFLAKVFGTLIILLVLWWLKDRYTYPRTGFVRGRRITAGQVLTVFKNILLFLLLPIFGLLAITFFVDSGKNVLSSIAVWFPVGLGVLWALLLILAGEWMGLRRFRFLGVMILLAGIKIGFLQFSLGIPSFPANVQAGIFEPSVLDAITRALAGISLLTMISGLIIFFSGVLTFLQYRKANPTPNLEEV